MKPCDIFTRYNFFLVFFIKLYNFECLGNNFSKQQCFKIWTSFVFELAKFKDQNSDNYNISLSLAYKSFVPEFAEIRNIKMSWRHIAMVWWCIAIGIKNKWSFDFLPLNRKYVIKTDLDRHLLVCGKLSSNLCGINYKKN